MMIGIWLFTHSNSSVFLDTSEEYEHALYFTICDENWPKLYWNTVLQENITLKLFKKNPSYLFSNHSLKTNANSVGLHYLTFGGWSMILEYLAEKKTKNSILICHTISSSFSSYLLSWADTFVHFPPFTDFSTCPIFFDCGQ